MTARLLLCYQYHRLWGLQNLIENWKQANTVSLFKQYKSGLSQVLRNTYILGSPAHIFPHSSSVVSHRHLLTPQNSSSSNS